MGIKERINRLDGGNRQCPVCLSPGPYPKDMKVEIVMGEMITDPETGRALGYEKDEPEYCSGCGRELRVIQVKGLQDKEFWDPSEWHSHLSDSRDASG
jgi:hypothetical protein